MGKKLASAEPTAAEVFDRASEATGFDTRDLCWNASEKILGQTENAQLALTVVSIAAFSAFDSKRDTSIDAFAGHSVGAIAAAVASGYLTVESAAILAQQRGRLMSEAPGNGGMLAVAIPYFDVADELHQYCNDLALRFDLDVAAYNGPRQLVLAGSQASLEAAATGLGPKAKKLNVSHGFHSRLMAPVERDWASILDETPFSGHGGRYIGSAAGKATTDGSAVKEDLRLGLCSPVRWSSVMEETLCFNQLFIFGCGRAIARLARPYQKDREVFLIEDRTPHPVQSDQN